MGMNISFRSLLFSLVVCGIVSASETIVNVSSSQQFIDALRNIPDETFTLVVPHEGVDLSNVSFKSPGPDVLDAYINWVGQPSPTGTRPLVDLDYKSKLTVRKYLCNCSHVSQHSALEHTSWHARMLLFNGVNQLTSCLHRTGYWAEEHGVYTCTTWYWRPSVFCECCATCELSTAAAAAFVCKSRISQHQPGARSIATSVNNLLPLPASLPYLCHAGTWRPHLRCSC